MPDWWQAELRYQVRVSDMETSGTALVAGACGLFSPWEHSCAQVRGDPPRPCRILERGRPVTVDGDALADEHRAPARDLRRDRSYG